MTNFNQHVDTWETLGKDDPLWAVVSLNDKRGNRWELADFLKTGAEDVGLYRNILSRLQGQPDRFGQILDFGCGVGRLSRAWSAYAEKVTGLDVAGSMIAKALEINRDKANVEFVHNPHTDLRQFKDGSFDLVFSHICLQHIPWEITKGYLGEFARVCRRGGLVAFQLPARELVRSRAAVVRQRLVNALPFGLNRTYRKWRHGSATVFDVHYTPVTTVMQTVKSFGLVERLLAYDQSAGTNTEGFIYILGKE